MASENITKAPTHVVSIYIAGDLDLARQACREHCFAVGLCVTVEPVDYVYTGGAESGVRVGLINYPRFPADPAAIDETAMTLGRLLMERLCQQSFCVVSAHETTWISRRPL